MKGNWNMENEWLHIMEDIKNTTATIIYDSILRKLIDTLKEQNKNKKLNLAYRNILDSLSKTLGGAALDSIFPHLRNLTDDNVNVDYEYSFIAQEIRGLSGITKRESEEYTDFIFNCVSSINREAARNINSFQKRRSKKTEERSVEIQKSKDMSELSNLILTAISSYEKNSSYHTISEVESNLVGITGGFLDLSFFDGMDAMFEGRFKRLIENDVCVIEVYSGCRREAFLYVLKLLSDLGCQDRTKVIKSVEYWNEFTPDNDDILVSDFNSPIDADIHHNCINIRIHERTSFKQGDNDNYLLLRNRSKLQIKDKLEVVYGTSITAQEKIKKLLDKTNGYYSLIEAELGSFAVRHSWEGSKPDSDELKCIEQFLVLSSFTNQDFELLERKDFKPDMLLKKAREIDWSDDVPLFTDDKVKGVYSLNAPERLWSEVTQRDSEFTSYFIESAKKLLQDPLISSELANNILYSFILHYTDFKPCNYQNEGKFTYSDEMLFDDVASGLLNGEKRKEIIKAVTELCPSRMLDWFKDNPEMITDDNAEALILQMHDSRYSGECAELIVKNLKRVDEPCFNHCNSVINAIKEFFRPIADTSGLSADEVIRILNRSENGENLKDLIFDVLPRKSSCWFPCCVFYRYREYVKNFHRAYSEARKLAEYEIGWYLERASLDELTAFVKNVSFIYFDFYSPLSSAFRKVLNETTEEERMPLYLELFSLNNRYKEWPEENTEEKIGLLEKCLDMITPSLAYLKIAPYFSWYSNFDDVDSSIYINKLSEIVKEKHVSFSDYLKIPSFVGNQLMQSEYFAVLLDSYSVEESVSLDAYYASKNTNSLGYYLDCVRRKLGQEKLDGIFELLDDEERFRFIQSINYIYAKDLLLQLPVDKQNEYWSKVNNYCDSGLSSEEKKHALNKLIEVGNNDAVYKLVGFSLDEYSDDELCSIVDRLKKERAEERVAYLLSEKIFPRLRQYSDNGGISFDKVFQWELELLPCSELIKRDTFFIRRYKESPSILCRVYAISQDIFSKSSSRKYTDEEHDLALEILSEIKVCPGVDCDYNVDEKYLSSWIKDFIIKMEEQGQRYLVPDGIANTVIYSIPSFDVCLSDEVCRILDSVEAEYRAELIRRISYGIAYMQDIHTIDSVSSGRAALRFRDYEMNLKNKGLSIAPGVYKNLAEEYERRDAKERGSF